MTRLAGYIDRNFIRAGGKLMHADVLPDLTGGDKLAISSRQLSAFIGLGRIGILNGIENWHEQIQSQADGYQVDSPALFVAHLGTNEQEEEVLTLAARQNQTFIHMGASALQQDYRKYWAAIHRHGFTPEVRSRFIINSELSGSWLMLRKPGIDPLIKATGFKVTEEMWDAFPNLGEVYSLGNKEVDKIKNDPRKYKLAQLGLMLAMSQLRLANDDTQGYEDEMHDVLNMLAFDYSQDIPKRLEKAIQNAAWPLGV